MLSALLSLIAYRKLAGPSAHPNEPPVIPTSIPYVGHLVGMMRHRSLYYSKISSNRSEGIYTLRMPGSTTYVITSPALVAAMDRKHRAISFQPFAVEFGRRVFSIAHGRYEDVLAADEKCLHQSLTPGESLDSMLRVSLASATKMLSCDSSFVEGVKGQVFDLSTWARHLMTRITTDAVYGTCHNPFGDPEVEAGFWAFENGFYLYLGGISPRILAPAASAGRQTLFDAFARYHAVGGYKSASRLVQARYDIQGEQGLGVSESDLARLCALISFSFLSNTVPTATWVLWNIYSNDTLLAEVRYLLAACVRTSSSGGKPTRTLNISRVIKEAPLLTSLVHETLRVQTQNATLRTVKEDVWLNDQWFLRGGSRLLVSLSQVHNDTAAWGEGARDFDPKRFIRSDAMSAKFPGPAYRALGGGGTICCGRHFAVQEIIVVVAIMVLQYDLKPDGEQWTLPVRKPHIAKTLVFPDGVRVMLLPRGDLEDSEWQFTFS